LILKNRKVNQGLVARLTEKKGLGFEIIIWSFRGENHAREAAIKAGCENLFSLTISKPGYIVDNKGWNWTRFVKRLKIT